MCALLHVANVSNPMRVFRVGKYAKSEFGGGYLDPSVVESTGYSNFACKGSEGALMNCTHRYTNSCTSGRSIALECSYYLGSSIGARPQYQTIRVIM